MLAETIVSLVAAVLIALAAYLVGRGDGRDAERLHWAGQLAKASEIARRTEQDRQHAADENAKHTAAEMAALKAAADRTRGELDRLRDVLARRDRAAPSCPGAGADGAAVERQLLGECAAAIEAMARDADTDAARLRGWQHRARTVEGVAE